MVGVNLNPFKTNWGSFDGGRSGASLNLHVNTIGPSASCCTKWQMFMTAPPPPASLAIVEAELRVTAGCRWDGRWPGYGCRLQCGVCMMLLTHFSSYKAKKQTRFLGSSVVISSPCRGHLTPMGEPAKWNQAKENSSHIRQARQRTLLLLQG